MTSNNLQLEVDNFFKRHTNKSTHTRYKDQIDLFIDFLRMEENISIEQCLILIGLEQFKGIVSSQEVVKIENMIVLFLDRSILYEWIVYDHFMNVFPQAIIKMNRTQNGTTSKFNLNSDYNPNFEFKIMQVEP